MTDTAKEAAERLEAFTRMWGDFVTKMVAAGFTFSPTAPPPEALGQMRDAFLKGLGEQWDQYLRSEPFLENMKQSFDAAVAFREQMNRVTAGVQQQTGAVGRSDVDSLMMAVRQAEGRIVQRMEALSARVEELNRRVEAMDGHGKQEAGGTAALKPQERAVQPGPKGGPGPGKRKPSRKR